MIEYFKTILSYDLNESRFKIRRLGAVFKIICSMLVFYFVYQATTAIGGQLSTLKTHWLGVLYTALTCLIITVISAWKWQLIADNYGIPRLRLYWYFSEHWISQAVGLILFGFVGADVYRSVRMSKACKVNLKTAGKVVFEDRFWSVISLILFAITVRSWSYAGPSALILLLLPVALYKRNRFLIFNLSLISQSLKIFAVISIFSLLGVDVMESIANIEYLALTALIEFAPISFDGFGIGHFGLYLANEAHGLQAYNLYFVGKLIFRVLGVLFLFKSWSRKNLHGNTF